MVLKFSPARSFLVIIERYSSGFWIKDKKFVESLKLKEFVEKYLGIFHGATVIHKII
jgi:hypothetical protein